MVEGSSDPEHFFLVSCVTFVKNFEELCFRYETNLRVNKKRRNVHNVNLFLRKEKRIH